MTLRPFKKTEDDKIKKAIIRLKAEIGLDKNIKKSPLDVIRACRNEFSIIGPNINASTKGAGSYFNFLKK
jgi:hypothetical protein